MTTPDPEDKKKVTPSRQSPPQEAGVREAIRQLLLDLLSEYQTLEKPTNPELLKLHVEAYEDKVLLTLSTAVDGIIGPDEPLAKSSETFTEEAATTLNLRYIGRNDLRAEMQRRRKAAGL